MEVENIKWIGHASFILEDKIGNNVCFLDPYEIGNVCEKADVIFITHGHYDHCNEKDIQRLLTPKTIVVAAPNCVDKFSIPTKQIKIAEPEIRMEVNDILVRTIPAYNIKPDRLKYHPRENEWLGYILKVNGKDIYHAGDTDFVDEMKELGKIDIAMLPIGGTYTMSVDEAIEAANTIKAKITVPMHYKAILKDKAKEAEKRFKDAVSGEVIVMDEIA